ncbi:Cobalt-zinc-cadmium resistance protein CzcA [Labilithrix luteola]|uniref:Cobalt-zinc-cadmium resistance protein CzcA n=1 Tax=Labilithrix luteola TaxID=1391654 RepID=A0A0K1Q5I6_9BACT|nr:CusA/CzcA family heavy metal efflux RND transporter [Labilithrix luteola]AKV00984.1 Cobalt-zinc-cadmium resistance protein CzcA [Labilithrix luteola]
MLEAIALFAIRRRVLVVGILFAVLALGGILATRLPIDALPDVSTVQVDVLTQCGGLPPTEVERTVTFPIEKAMTGVPRSVQVRSVSRFGLSAVTIVFEDGTDIWHARQLVLERMRQAQSELPPSAGSPELAPPSTGLGTIYKFVVKSEHHSPMQLRTILDWEIGPKLKTVKGVIEVNSFGGELKQYQVVVDPKRLHARGLTLNDVVDALRAANVNVGGGYVERGGESYSIRGQGMLTGEKDIAAVVVRSEKGQPPLLISHVAEVRVGSALRYGVVTHNGEREAVSGLVMMLAGSNSRDVITAVKAKMVEIQRELPPGVGIEVVYDRADFVGRTLKTVGTNLVEALFVVTIVLAVMLGSVRGALAVAIGMPASMAIAIFGMHLFHVTGDLMSLGAIDFGFLVDGPIVILEAIIAATAGRKLVGSAKARAYADVARSVVSPVAFAVAIIMLVYIPLLTLEGVEGKMFRPMAITMSCALFGGLVYAVLFFPALLVAFVPPKTAHGPKWIESLTHWYEGVTPALLRHRWPITGAAVAMLVASAWLFGRAGAEFIPRIFEGDAIIAMQRTPSISLDEARKLDLMTEKVLKALPEVRQVLGQSGRAELALDAVGNENTDMLVPLKPLKEWTTAKDLDELSVIIKNRIETEVPATFVSVSQPIEDLTNQLIAGSRADVSIKVIGTDLEALVAYSNKVGDAVRGIAGTGDLKIERLIGAPVITATADRARMAQYGVRVRHAFDVLEASREGVKVGDVYERERRFDLRVFVPPGRPTAEGLADLFVETNGESSIPMRDVVRLEEGEGPAVVKRLDRERLIRIDVNLRGRDLVSWVEEAKQKVAHDVPLDSGYRIEWGGQFENYERASKRLALVIPAVVAIIIGMLFWMFKSARPALAVFSVVPLAASGGMIGLLLRGLPFSLPAAVGFIALGGVSVLNGVVISSTAKARMVAGDDADRAVAYGAAHSVRAVLTTAAVAALGFFPMALSTSAGSEVQRPLATVVIVGMVFGTVLTLAVFPGILATALKGWKLTEQDEHDELSDPLEPSRSAAE